MIRKEIEMVDSAAMTGPPRKLLLATDLSARCDRALERAVSLASDWQAQLTVLHVFEEEPDTLSLRSERSKPSWRRPPDAAAIAKQRIRQALRADLGDAIDQAAVMVEEGEPAEVIGSVASSEGSELIITGIARERPFAPHPVVLGKTVEQLVRRSPTPVLIVRNRARAAYQHILVATDFSDTSARALQAGLQFFPLQSLRLLHAFDPPYASLVPDAASFDKNLGEGLTNELESFLGSSGLTSDDRRRVEPLVERGRPDALVRAYVNDRNADLVVLGTQGRGPMLEVLIGSTAKSILSVLPCDALVVRALRR
jgi:nucleotide-binding universal stress UspA family protein